jgi:hypothetical protein
MTEADGLYRLIYVSRNALGGSPEEMEGEVFHILDQSRRNNARDGITGALLFSDDCFAQALEGGAPAVHRVFERIQIDPRHRDTVVLTCEPAPGREFGDWSMAYVGRLEPAETRYAELARPEPGSASAASGRVLDLLRGVVQRTAMA